MDEPVRRTRAVDQCLEKDGEQRRQDLRDGEGGEGEPAASSQEEQSDDRESEGTAEPVPEPIERQREVGQERGFEVMHCLGPAAVHAEGAFRYEDGDQDDEREHSAGCPKSMSAMREKRLTGGSRRCLATGSGLDGRWFVHVRYMCVEAKIQNSISAISNASSQSVTTKP